MKLANKLGARYAIILGEDEVKQHTATLRDMTTNDQRAVGLNELVEELKNQN
jgi:histidyl-tRNA synthetase